MICSHSSCLPIAIIIESIHLVACFFLSFHVSQNYRLPRELALCIIFQNIIIWSWPLALLIDLFYDPFSPLAIYAILIKKFYCSKESILFKPSLFFTGTNFTGLLLLAYNWRKWVLCMLEVKEFLSTWPLNIILEKNWMCLNFKIKFNINEWNTVQLLFFSCDKTLTMWWQFLNRLHLWPEAKCYAL